MRPPQWHAYVSITGRDVYGAELEVGDVLQEGDLFASIRGDGWRVTGVAGEPLRQEALVHARYVRPLPPPDQDALCCCSRDAPDDSAEDGRGPWVHE